MYSELKRTCRNCEITKDLEDFYHKNLHKEGRCKQCVSLLRKKAYKADPDKTIERVRKYRTGNPEKIRDTKLKQAHGVGLEWFNATLIKQNGTCAGCKRPEKTLWKGKIIALSVDHDHATGEPRGLLCMRCNRAFGLLEEDIDTMTNLIEYKWKFKK